ncbi:unnamed protein product, partial [Effrenium voratum]
RKPTPAALPAPWRFHGEHLARCRLSAREAYSLAQQFVDNIRGVACGSFHACLLQKDAQLFFFGDDSANQCRVPETLVPKVFTVDPAQLPLGILADRKPKLLESAPEPEPNPDPPQPP